MVLIKLFKTTDLKKKQKTSLNSFIIEKYSVHINSVLESYFYFM